VWIAESARRHGVADVDIHHALANTVRSFVGDNITISIGPDRAGRLVEVGWIPTDDGEEIVVHAMRPARPKYLR
jgi:hypothetical protein